LLWNAGEAIRTKMVEAIEPEKANELIKLLSRLADSLNEESLSGSSLVQ
jgi:hypothetical protein